jgi:16S rRNA (cytosine967-C5)-methyltransferase
VIRRHPDIKLLRHAADIARYAAVQSKLLAELWPLLAKGGKLLYVTCSILPAENQHRIEAFLDEHHDAQLLPIDAPWADDRKTGYQILPSTEGMDGFYYALLHKRHQTECLPR